MAEKSAVHTPLKPCPFCGGEAVMAHGFDEENDCFEASIVCTCCGAFVSRMHENDARPDTIVAWSTRADKTYDELVDALRSCVDSLEFIAGEIAKPGSGERGSFEPWSHPNHSIMQARKALALADKES